MSSYASTSMPAGTTYSAVNIGGTTYYEYISGGSGGSGGVVVSTTIPPVLQAGDKLYVEAGAVANGIESVSSGGGATIQIMNGGELLSSTINNGTVYVASGGIASGNTENAVKEYLSAGGSSVDESILKTAGSAGGFLSALAGATVTSDIVVSSGAISVAAGATATSVTVGASGILSNGGTVTDITVTSGGTVENSGAVTSAHISSGGIISSTSGSTATSVIVSSGGGYVGPSLTGVSVKPGGAATSAAAGTTYSAVLIGNQTYYQVGGSSTTTPPVLQKGDTLYVEAGAVASGIETVSGGGATVYVLNGGILENSTINRGIVHVAAGGIASGNIENSVAEHVSAGGSSLNETILKTAGGTTGFLSALAGASVTGDLVASSGTIKVASGATVTGVTVGVSGTLSNDGTATTITVTSGGTMVNSASLTGAQVSSGGIISSTKKGSVAQVTVSSGGGYAGPSLTGVIVQPGGAAASAAAGTTYSAVSSGGQTIYEYKSGGQVFSSTTPPLLQNGDTLYIEANAVASGIETTTGSDAYIYVSNGGELLSSTIDAGYLYVSSGGVASGNTENAVVEQINRGGSSIDETVLFTGNLPGYLTAYAGATVASDTVISSGLIETLAGATLTSITVGSGGVVSNFASATDITVNSGGLLINSGTVSDFTISSGGLISGFGTYGSGGLYPYAGIVGDAPDITPLCFYPGTRLHTPTGTVAVEEVTAGMLLLTASGAARPVRWLGRSEASTRFADPLRVLPIRIKARALGDGLPTRDLLVSPDHAIFLRGLLIQAAALVNDRTILRESDVPECFTYYHVELATHELLIAEGVPAESFVDNVDRMHFSNWSERDGLAQPEPIAEMPYPRVKSRRQLPPAIIRHLGDQAARLVAKASEAA